MRIAMLGTRGMPATHGGVERAVEELSARLASRGHEVTVYCRSGYCEDRRPAHRGVRLRYLPAVPSKHLEAASHSFLAALASAAGPYDLVHIHSVGPALFSPIPRLAGRKVVVTVHALDWKRRKWGAVSRLALRLGAWAATRAAHATITVSSAAGRYLRERHGREAIHLPNGVSLPQSPRREGPLAQGGGYFLFLGRLVPEKRIDDLIAAFKTTETNTRLVVAGDGYFSDRHVEELRRMAFGDARITFAGGVYGRRKEDLLEGAAALVNPSELEGHPIAVLEAMAHGVPVLASDIEEHREIFEREGAPACLGLLFGARDRGELRQGLQQVLRLGSDATSREERRGFVARHYDWDRIAAATEELYGGLSRVPDAVAREEGRSC